MCKNNSNGFIKIYRKLIDWEWYSDVPAKVLFMHLLLTANFEPKRWKDINIKKGQLAAGVFELSKNTGLSVQQVRTAIKKLKSTNEITIKTTNKFSVITVVNYENYQHSNKQNVDPSNKQITNKQQTNNKQITTTKEYKNIRIKELKEKEKEKEKEKNFNEILEFEDLINFWNKNKTGSKYKNSSTKNMALNKLKELSGNNFNISKKIVEQSLANGWQGLFPYKKDIATGKSIVDHAISISNSDGLKITTGGFFKDENRKGIRAIDCDKS